MFLQGGFCYSLYKGSILRNVYSVVFMSFVKLFKILDVIFQKSRILLRTIGIFWILFFFVKIVGDRFWVNIIVLLCRELILGKWIVLSLIFLISEVVKFIFFLSFFVLFLFLKRILIYCKMFNLEFVKWEYKNVVWRFIMIILLLFVVC